MEDKREQPGGDDRVEISPESDSQEIRDGLPKQKNRQKGMLFLAVLLFILMTVTSLSL